MTQVNDYDLQEHDCQHYEDEDYEYDRWNDSNPPEQEDEE